MSLQILFPALKRWRPLKWHRLCSHSPRFRATTDFVLCSKALGIPPRWLGLCSNVPTHGPLMIGSMPMKLRGLPRQEALGSRVAHLWAIADFVPRFIASGTPLDCRGYVANLPTCGPLLILPPALKRWGPPRWLGLCSQFADLRAIADWVRGSKGLHVQGTSICVQSHQTRSLIDLQVCVCRLLVVGSTPEWSHAKNVVGPR